MDIPIGETWLLNNRNSSGIIPIGSGAVSIGDGATETAGLFPNNPNLLDSELRMASLVNQEDKITPLK